MSIKPVIVAVAYKRAKSLRRLLKTVGAADYDEDSVTLIISIDYCSDNADVIDAANEFEWKHGDKIVKTHEQNLGLKTHIIECGDYSLKYGAVIILEDDQAVAPSFYRYVKTAHEYYQNDSRVAGVSLYSHEWNGYVGRKFQPYKTDGDVYFGQFSCTRGQSWTKEQWIGFKNWITKNDDIKRDELLPPIMYDWKKSWGKFFSRYIVEQGKYYVMPYKPVSTVFGETGTNTVNREYDVQVALYCGHGAFDFIPFEKGQHYDIFFENMALKDVIARRYHVDRESVAIDLYACPGREYGDKQYVLTTRKLNRHVVDCFALDVRPHEMNVIWDIKGDTLKLYDMSKFGREKKHYVDDRLDYDFAGVHGMEAVHYGIRHCFRIFCSMLREK